MKSRKAVLASLKELNSDASAGAAGAGVGADAEAAFMQSYHRHRRLSSDSLTAQPDGLDTSFHSAPALSDSGSGDEGVGTAGAVPAEASRISHTIGVRPAGDLQTPILAVRPQPSRAPSPSPSSLAPPCPAWRRHASRGLTAGVWRVRRQGEASGEGGTEGDAVAVSGVARIVVGVLALSSLGPHPPASA